MHPGKLDELIEQAQSLVRALQREKSSQNNREEEPERPMPPPELSGADEGIFQLGSTPSPKEEADDEFNMDDLDQHFIAAKFEPEKASRLPTQVKLVPEEDSDEDDKENVADEVLACVGKINANYGSTKEEIHDFMMKSGTKIKSYKIMRTIRALDKEKRLKVVNKKPKTYKLYPQMNNVVRLNKA